MANKPRIVDIAEVAGVSVATVSRVLSGKDAVSQDTETKVRQAAAKMGYTRLRSRQPGEPVKDLKHGFVSLLWGAGRESMSSLGGQNLMMGLTDGLRKYGGHLGVDHLSSNREGSQIHKARSLDGVFLHGEIREEDIPDAIRTLPLVWLYNQGSHEFGDRVQPDHAKVGELACRHFAKIGCKRVYCVRDSALDEPMYSHFRANSFLEKARTMGLAVDEVECPLPVDASGRAETDRMRGTAAAEDAAKVALKFSKESPRPDAIFVANHLGPYLHMELTKLNIIPMKDVCLVAGDYGNCSQFPLSPEPITVRIFSHQIGMVAVEQLLLRIRNPGFPPIICLVAPQLHFPE